MTRHYLVSGIVQGVGFRAFTLRKGQGLGLTGWVRNLADGRVEVLAVGEPESQAEFLRLIQSGPSRARVLAVELKEIAEEFSFSQFEMRGDGGMPWSGS